MLVISPWILFGPSKKPLQELCLKRVAWPPPPEESSPFEPQTQGQLIDSPPVRSVQPPGPQSPQAARRFQPVQPPFQQPQTPPGSYPEQPPLPSSPPTFQPIKFEPPKTVVQLRPSPPIRQAPSPVYSSQPVTVTYQGGQRMRGDQKWPPESVKQQAEAENMARIALAKGPACRPRKVKKDYSTFFAQHALNSTYPGYRAPPGTQHYPSEGTSDL
ncbi:unnamed protein product [Nesidiocoris tenuis]|uniref:Uncharacterized protein n=1 Tax=Nesidiocoris tenuis TaxID=355587 RepID=A0A6H5GVX6_9HEMI|nr:unnamed protein product [Nesidiocoris tenuis]